jgi:hypothetical protein
MPVTTLRRRLPIALAGLAAVAAPGPARGQDTAPTLPVTHLNVPAALVVNLEMRASSSPFGGNLNRRRPDGTIEAQPYTVPAGYSLIVTDISSHRSFASPLQRTFHELYHWSPDNPNGHRIIYAGAGDFTQRYRDSRFEVHFTAGLVIGPGCQLSGSTHPDSLLPGRGFWVQGYLVPNPPPTPDQLP